MTQAYLEHVNVTVADANKTAALLVDLFDWHIRWSGPARDGGYTVHAGTTDHYLAVYQPSDGQSRNFPKGAPLNHVDIVVDDLDAVEAKVITRGLKPFNHGDYDPGRRFYFFDNTGIEFEIVSYR